MILPRESVPRKLWPIPILLIPTGNKRTVTDPDHRQIFLEHTKNHESDEINTPLLNLNLNRLVSWSHYFSLLMSIWLSFGKKSVRSQQTEERERQKTFSIQQSQTFCMSSIQPHFKTSTTAAAAAGTEKELRPRLRKSWHFKVKHPGSQAKLFWQSGSRTARELYLIAQGA